MSNEKNTLVLDPKKPFVVFCHHDTVRDQNAILLPTHFSMLTCKNELLSNGEMGYTYEVKTNAIYCPQNGEIKFNNGYPQLMLAELTRMVHEVLKDVDAVQIINSSNQLYFVRKVLEYEGPVIQVHIDQPYKKIITANACIPLTNHNTFSCSHCLILAIASRQIPGFACYNAEVAHNHINRWERDRER